jgi:hypothetical protein
MQANNNRFVQASNHYIRGVEQYLTLPTSIQKDIQSSCVDTIIGRMRMREMKLWDRSRVPETIGKVLTIRRGHKGKKSS